MPRRLTDAQVRGLRSGRIEVLGIDCRTPEGNLRVRVICDCGTEKSVLWQSVRSQETKSCGCLQAELGKSSIAKVNATRGRTGSRSPADPWTATPLERQMATQPWGRA